MPSFEAVEMNLTTELTPVALCSCTALQTTTAVALSDSEESYDRDATKLLRSFTGVQDDNRAVIPGLSRSHAPAWERIRSVKCLLQMVSTASGNNKAVHKLCISLFNASSMRFL